MMLDIRELSSDSEIAAAFSLMAEPRPHLEAGSFVAIVNRQRRDGYRLYGGFADARLVAMAGVRDAHTLMRGPHLFVDDLVTLRAEQGKRYGTAMLQWLATDASSRGIGRLYLDSRDTALGFYKRLGFQEATSIPCWIDVTEL